MYLFLFFFLLTRDSSKWLFMNISFTPEKKETRRFNRFGNLIETNLFFTIVGWCVMRQPDSQ